jgi:DNA-binding NarL/FixJ family response regulator
MTLKTLIVDDHEFFRKTFRRFLEEIHEIGVISEAGNGRQAIASLERSIPDLVIMDVNMPELDGIKVCQTIKASYPDLKVILYTLHDPELYLANGPSGPDRFIPKDRLFKELPAVLRELC